MEKIPETRQAALDLPGLSVPKSEGALLAAATATIEALQGEGVLTARHAITCQVVLQLAEAVDRGLAAARVSVATATLSKQLIESIESLPEPLATPAGDAWDELQRQIEEAAKAEAGLGP